jgi:hypothetical protein
VAGAPSIWRCLSACYSAAGARVGLPLDAALIRVEVALLHPTCACVQWMYCAPEDCQANSGRAAVGIAQHAACWGCLEAPSLEPSKEHFTDCFEHGMMCCANDACQWQWRLNHVCWDTAGIRMHAICSTPSAVSPEGVLGTRSHDPNTV